MIENLGVTGDFGKVIFTRTTYQAGNEDCGPYFSAILTQFRARLPTSTKGGRQRPFVLVEQTEDLAVIALCESDLHRGEKLLGIEVA